MIDDYMPAMPELPWNDTEDGVILSPARLAHLELRSMYRYFEPPSISSLLPDHGPAAGGFTVTVRGVGFDRMAGQGNRPVANASLCRFGTPNPNPNANPNPNPNLNPNANANLDPNPNPNPNQVRT